MSGKFHYFITTLALISFFFNPYFRQDDNCFVKEGGWGMGIGYVICSIYRVL